jgi:hypothetical protein
MNVPSIIVEMQLEEQTTNINNMPEIKKVPFELTNEALVTMLDGLGI